MNNKFNKKLFTFLLSLFPFIGYAETKEIKDQDGSKVYSENPLQGLKKLSFFALIPTGIVGESYGDLEKEVKKELQRHGKVETFSIFVKTPDGEEAADFSSFSGCAYMDYKIGDVYSVDGKKLDFVRASLNIREQVTINRTKVDTGLSIWTRNCFLPGSVDKNLKDLVKTSLAYLMNDFSKSYKEVNESQPSFNLYSP